MKRKSALLAIVWLIGCGVADRQLGAKVVPSRPLESWVGMKAPEFSLVGTDGKRHSIGKLTEGSNVIVVWFPKAYTGNVERMLRQIDERRGELVGSGIKVVAASCDKEKYLKPFAKELGLELLILSDPTRTTAIQWGVVHQGREIPERWAYFIGKEGRIAYVLDGLEGGRVVDQLKDQASKLGWMESRAEKK